MRNKLGHFKFLTPARRKVSLAAAATLLLVGASSLVFSQENAPMPRGDLSTPAAAPHLQQQGSPMSFADLVERVAPAVVTVTVQRSNGQQQLSEFDLPMPFRDGPQFGQRRGQGQSPDTRPRSGGQVMGSGFIIDRTGYIVTNNHVVEDGSRISVKLPGGREYQARLIGTDKATDVAVLKIEGANNLPSVELGDDRRLRVGDWVVAVGNPFGLGGTVTAGIISSIGRDIGNGPYTDYIQIDAPINQGNSGGPTFDLSGRVIGMNTAIYSPSGGSVGIGFAIPASTVRAIVEQLKTHGSVERGWLGVQVQTLTPEMTASIGAVGTKGAIVADVVEDSPAAAAGFQEGDVILAVNGAGVEDSRDLTQKVAGLHAGERVQFSIMRDGQRRNLSCTVGKRDDQEVASANRPRMPNPGNGRMNRN